MKFYCDLIDFFCHDLHQKLWIKKLYTTAKNFRKKVRGIRTMIWFHLIKYYSGGLSASQLELFFEPEKFQHLEPVDQNQDCGNAMSMVRLLQDLNV
ncbi:hypothetical protein DKE44_019695 (plasmid) [Acinetobacter nosocomialis]|nr:hypothetical protein DKE44_019695 [Acinetobacter nosocomialis]